MALAHLQWEKMQPGMARLDRLEELVAKVKEDMDKLEVQLEQARFYPNTLYRPTPERDGFGEGFLPNQFYQIQMICL